MKDKQKKIEESQEKEKTEPELLELEEEKLDNSKTTMLSRAFRNDSSKLPSYEMVKFTEEGLQQAAHMIKSGLLPDSVTKPETAIIIMQKGKEMGFSPMASFEHVVVINGKPSLDGAAIGTLLRQGGVEWEVIRNCEPEYVVNEEGKIIPHVTGNKDGKIVTVPATEEHLKKGLETKPKIIDYITEIKFYRKSNIIKDKILEHTSIFTYKDATVAGLTDKDVWKKYLKSMLFWRTLSLGGRQFAPDLLVGMPTAEELDSEGTIYFDENGRIVEYKK